MDLEQRLENGFRWFVRNAPRKTPGWLPRWLGRGKHETVNYITGKLLEELADLERLDLLPVADARAEFETLSLRLPFGPESVVEREVSLGDIPAKLFIPQKVRRRGDCLVYAHGGGFAIGSVEAFAPLCRTFAEDLGMPVISLEYGLAPELKHPGQPTQVREAVEALGDPATLMRLGIPEARNVHLSGDSAGGNLVAHAAMDVARVRPRSLILIYPWTDLRISSDQPSLETFGTGHFLSLDAIKWFRRLYLESESEQELSEASPMLRSDPDLRRLPPTLTVIAECDPLRDQNRAFAARLHALDTRHTSAEYSTMPHGFMLWPGVISYSNEAIKRIASFLEAVRN